MTEENRQFDPTMRELQAKYMQMKNLERALQNEKIRLTQKDLRRREEFRGVENASRDPRRKRRQVMKYQMGEAAIYAKADIEDPSKVFLVRRERYARISTRRSEPVAREQLRQL